MAASLGFRYRFFFRIQFLTLVNSSHAFVKLLFVLSLYECAYAYWIFGIGVEFVRGKLSCIVVAAVDSSVLCAFCFFFLIFHFESQIAQWSVSQMVASVHLICIMGAKHLMNTFFPVVLFCFSSLRFFSFSFVNFFICFKKFQLLFDFSSVIPWLLLLFIIFLSAQLMKHRKKDIENNCLTYKT